MKGFIKSVNSLPLIIKLLLCIPGIEIFYGICRVINQASKRNNGLMVLVAILTIIPGAAFMWLIDIIWVLWKKHAIMLG